MAKRMLIDATHPEETRVVVLNGNRLEEFDFESSTKKQVKGNIYLAKVTRVEPSLQAAFVDYGNNRHGFLAFSEIHPDYFKIPVGDREPSDTGPVHEEAETREAGSEIPDGAGIALAAALPELVPVPANPEGSEDETPETELPEQPSLAADETASPIAAREGEASPLENLSEVASFEETRPSERSMEPPWADFSRGPEIVSEHVQGTPEGVVATPSTVAAASLDETIASTEEFAAVSVGADILAFTEASATTEARAEGDSEVGELEAVETLGGDELEEAEHQRSRTIRHYKIQEVIKRRQIMLVQVTKEERGNKGAALTTYLSLAGRYCVLMPNTARGGGVSRKITSISDRRRLKDILEDLDIPEGMGVIVRTAGAERSKAEIKRDYEYLLRLWNEIRDLTLKSTAPALIYEEGNLIKRSIRDLYTRDIDEVLVEGEEGYRTAKAFMRTLMPSHAKRVQPYRDPEIGLLHRFQVESQIDAIHSPVAQLRSGGYVVINQTEALVSIDVNSGRSTRERNIEETALRTNLEAADEIARQLRLRDLAGLIVIDFIDMEEHRNQIAVERRLKEALKNDRARIQVGRISPFGLLEMSRQRLRPSLAEASTQPCPHCGGTGFIRSVESTALYVLRSIEEEGIRRRSAEICIYVPTTVALYILNQKRESLAQIEARYGVRVTMARDDSLIPPSFRLERLRAYGAGEAPPVPRSIQAPAIEEEEEDEAAEEEEDIDAVPSRAVPAEGAAEQESDEERGHRRRRRRRRRSDEPREGRAAPATTAPEAGESPDAAEAPAKEPREAGEEERESDAERRRRRRGRRGGRQRGRREEGGETPDRPTAAETIEIVPPVEDQRVVEEAAEAASLEPWPGDAGYEAASLAPFAGEGAEPAPPAASERGEVGDPNPAPTAVSDREVEREPTPAPTAESEEGVPFVSATERVLEEAAAPPANSANGPASELPVPPEPASPNPDVLTVTEKPANPRRGWWQRLVQ